MSFRKQKGEATTIVMQLLLCSSNILHQKRISKRDYPHSHTLL
jgi:hypothetical protein